MENTNNRHIVVTVHGIRTYGEWQSRLEKVVHLHLSNHIKFKHFRYSYFSLLAFWFPPIRWFQVRRFAKELAAIMAEKPHRLDLVGHSFGTHLIGWALR